ncbi:odorant receptor 4-like [Cataglyphis hispanica]|uniref:odorant receptor 4-like n=1 Tax=Cataglyphis hispanica TaxID=1086592 RepID=UPI00217F4AD1|nr:odorant receptor 4-like [Cataglyphis hispanica]
MICVKTRHFSLHRILLLAIGLWPCQRSRLAQFQLILCFGILISFIICQLTIIVTAEFTLELAINVLSIGLFFTMLAIMYNSFGFNFAEMVKRPLEELQQICNGLKDEKEIAIMKKYGDNLKRHTFTITLFYICSQIIILSIISLPFISRIFALHINESQSHILYKCMPKYLVDQENYLYLIVLYVDTSIFIGGTAMVATGLMLIAYLKHACGMFRIASYRIKKAINMQNNVPPKNEIAMYKGIIYAVDIHRTAMKFCTFLFSYLHLSHFFLIVVGVVCLSLNLYAISEIVLHGGDIDQFLLHFLIVIIIFIYLFFANYAGQELTDHNNDIFFAVYSVQWYAAPLHIQRLILFLLQRGSKAVNLNLGGVSILSLQFFATLTKASISYFTVMYSTQQ